MNITIVIIVMNELFKVYVLAEAYNQFDKMTANNNNLKKMTFLGHKPIKKYNNISL